MIRKLQNIVRQDTREALAIALYYCCRNDMSEFRTVISEATMAEAEWCTGERLASFVEHFGIDARHLYQPRMDIADIAVDKQYQTLKDEIVLEIHMVSL